MIICSALFQWWAYRVSHRGLQRCILLLLAADVIKSEKNVVVIRQ